MTITECTINELYKRKINLSTTLRGKKNNCYWSCQHDFFTHLPDAGAWKMWAIRHYVFLCGLILNMYCHVTIFDNYLNPLLDINPLLCRQITEWVHSIQTDPARKSHDWFLFYRLQIHYASYKPPFMQFTLLETFFSHISNQPIMPSPSKNMYVWFVCHRLRNHYASYEPTLRQLKSKYESAMKEKMLTKLERDRAVGQVQGLQSTLKNLDDMRSGRSSSAGKPN